MKKTLFQLILPIFFLAGCIGDDIIFDTVTEAVRIQNPLDSLALGESFQFEATFFNNVGFEESATLLWESSDPTILSITPTGLATGLQKGMVFVKASLQENPEIRDSMEVFVASETVGNVVGERTGSLNTTSSYALQGDFVLKEDRGSLVLEFGDDYKASSALPGLYLYMTNNPNTVTNSVEIGEVKVFNGAHSYEIPSSVSIDEYEYLLYYCKPFNVKVGDGKFDN